MVVPTGKEISIPSVFRFSCVPGICVIPNAAVTTPVDAGHGKRPLLFSKLIDISLPSGVDSSGVYALSLLVAATPVIGSSDLGLAVFAAGVFAFAVASVAPCACAFF